ncbi:MAG: hypothetical protein OXE94_10090 [Aestuariivita sp.]|nr:hypothetical protein [Aestuariivita sp.]MCY4202936.1 hypothetical protein [Aestuariivita sp.]
MPRNFDLGWFVLEDYPGQDGQTRLVFVRLALGHSDIALRRMDNAREVF